MTNDKDYAILGMDLNRLNEFLKNLVEHYEEDRIMIPMGPSGIGIAMHPDTEKMFRDKFHLTEEGLNELNRDITFFVGALVVDKEERILKKYGKTEKVTKILEIFKERLQDQVIETLRFRLFCKTQYLEDLSWDVSVRVRQNGGIKMRFPFSVIRMSFSKPGLSLQSILGEESAVTFECSLRDIDEMIKSLEEIRNALGELQQEEGEKNE